MHAFARARFSLLHRSNIERVSTPTLALQR
jgi:hypothetical protein